MLRVEKISDSALLQKCTDFWPKRMADPPYYSYEWYVTALETLDVHSMPYIFIVRRNQRVVGIAPFILRERRVLWKKLKMVTFIDHAYTPCQDIYMAETGCDVFESLSEVLVKQSKPMLLLKEMKSDSLVILCMKKILVEKGYLCNLMLQSRNNRIVTNGNFDDALGRLSSHARKEFNRKLNRIRKLGDIRLELFVTFAEVRQHLDTFFKLYERTWKGKEPKPDFYYKLAERFCKKRSLRLYCLYVNNRPAAYLYSILGGDTLYGIKTTFDPSFLAFSPGVILFYKVIESLYADDKIKCFEFGRGDERFKKEWKPTEVEQFCLEAYPKTLFFVVYSFLKHDVLQKLKHLKVIRRFLGAENKIKHWFRKYRKRLFSCEKIILLVKLVADSAENDTFIKSTRLANSDDVEKLAVAMGAPNLKTIVDKFKRKDLCLVSEHDGCIDKFCWLTNDLRFALKCDATSFKIDWRDKEGGWYFAYEHNLSTAAEVNSMVEEALGELILLNVKKIGLIVKNAVPKDWKEIGFQSAYKITYTNLMGTARYTLRYVHP